MLQNTTGATAPSTELLIKQYGCQTCAIEFDGSESQRVHMRGDWHVYNLKRRMAVLPSISVTSFQQQAFPSHSGKDDSISSEKSCDACKQRYTNQKLWKAHLQSTRHARSMDELNSRGAFSAESSPLSKDISSIQISPTKHDKLELERLYDDDDEDDDEKEDEDEEVFSPLQCLFCGTESTSLDSNLLHMGQSHSFFIRDADYLIDLESFLSYLFAVVAVFHECLFCGNLRDSKLGVQNHMRDKGHCKLNYFDNEDEIREFYDFGIDEGDREGAEKARPVVIDGEEMHLPTGKTLVHRSRIHHSHRPFQKESSSVFDNLEEAAPHLDHVPLSPELKDRSLALRAGTFTSLIGVPQLQQRALIAVEKKILKVETIARKENEAGVERGANRQKRFKVRSIGKKQGGLEKRNG